MKEATLHSIETMGLVDGPGIRTIFFLQGCPLRCQYCHNPDSQHFMGENTITVDEVVKMASRYVDYYKATGGGVTFSGGEPLMQAAFVAEAAKALKEIGVNTCVDTSGFGISKYYDAVLDQVDYLLVDIKHVNPKDHERMVGRPMDGIMDFIDALKRFTGKITIRHVMVPGETDNEESMRKLLNIIKPIQKSVEKIEILPYHRAGVEKYSQLNLPYLLEGVPEMNHDVAHGYEVLVNQWLNVEKDQKVAV